MKGDGIRADFTVTDSGEEAERRRRRPGARRRRRRRTTPPTCRTSPTSCSPKTQQFVDARTRPATTTRPARSTPTRARTGSGSRRSPSRSATSTRRWTSARPTSSPARSGPAGTGSRRTCGPQRAEDYTPLTPRQRGDVRRRPARQHRDPRQAHPGARRSPSTRSPTAPRAARGGRDRQGHRRGGVLVAHRPVGLPGQRRRRPRRLRGRRADRSSSKDPELADDPRRRGSPSCRRCSTQQRDGDGFVLYDELTPTQVKELVRRRQRAVRAAVPASPRRCSS